MIPIIIVVAVLVALLLVFIICGGKNYSANESVRCRKTWGHSTNY